MRRSRPVYAAAFLALLIANAHSKLARAQSSEASQSRTGQPRHASPATATSTRAQSAPAATKAEPHQDKKACTLAYEEGQRLKQNGALIEAREHLLMCGGPSCPSVMHADCERWLSELEFSLPTVVFQVKSEQHGELENAQVAIDGKAPVALKGRALSLDPGEHRVRFSADAHVPVERRYFFSEGEKLRRESITLPVVESPDAPEASASSAALAPRARTSRFGAPVIVASSVAAVGLGVFVFFGLDARSKDRALGDCEPACSHAQIDATRDRYLYANIALGVGAAGLATAVILYLVHPGKADVAFQQRPRSILSAAPAVSAAGFRF